MLIAIIIGLSIGSIYGLTAMGLVLTYRTSGVFNLAHGAVGMLGTYVYWQLRVDWNWPVPLALFVAVALVSPLIGACMHLAVFRWVRDRPIAVTLVATIALLVILQGIASAIWGTIFKDLPSLFPFHLFAVTPSFNVTSEQIGTMGVTLAIVLALLTYLQKTKFGLKTRAVVDNRDLAEVNGYDSERIQMISWGVAAALSTLSGILISPFIQLSFTGLTLVVIQAMAAAVVGRLESLPLTYLGGLGLGVLESLLAKYLPSSQAAQGLKVSAAFLVLYGAVILASLRGKVFGGGLAEVRTGLLGREVRASYLSPLFVLFGAILLVTPLLPSYLRFLVTSALISSIAFQGFVLVTGLGGQVLLCQAAFVGIGAIMYSRMVTDWQLPVLVAVGGALLVALVLGLSVSLPALRIRGLPLALLTLAFALFMDSFVFVAKSFSGGYSGFTVPRPSLFGLNLANDDVMRYVALTAAFLAALLVRNLASGRTGRLVTAVRNSESAAESFGTSVRNAKLVLFGLSSVLGALSGVLIAIQVQSVAAVQFNIFQSILFLAVAVLGGVGSAQGAVVGALLLYIVPQTLDSLGLLDYQQLLFGAGAVAVLVARRGGVSDMLFRPLVARLRRPRAGRSVSNLTGAIPQPPRPGAGAPELAKAGAR